MTPACEQRFTNSQPSPLNGWRMDEDGFLRVTARVIKEGVYPYSAGECLDREALDALPGVDPVMQLIPRSEFTPQALASLEGKPVTIPLPFAAEAATAGSGEPASPPSGELEQDWHQWREPDNALRDFLTVGTIAGRPRVDAEGGIVCDMLIMDPGAIQGITTEADPDKRLVEVSAGYLAMLDIRSGRYRGQPYHGVQKDLKFNHVLLLPEGMGRCGNDVRIMNRSPGGPPGTARLSGASTNNNGRERASGKQAQGAGKMPTTLKVTVGNRARSYKFLNEEDAAQAESMLEEQKTFDAEEVAAAIAARAELEERIEELQTLLAEQDERLEQARAQLEELLSPAAQEALAEELVEQKEAEEVIMDAETGNMGDYAGEPGKEKEEFVKALHQCNSLAERRRVTVSRVMNLRGKRVDGWNQDAFDGAFEVLAVNARNDLQARRDGSRVTNGRKSSGRNANAADLSPRDRMLRPMKARNAR